MTRSPEGGPSLDRLVLLILLMALLFLSPAVLWWANPSTPWYVVYILWLLVIVIGARMFTHERKHG